MEQLDTGLHRGWQMGTQVLPVEAKAPPPVLLGLMLGSLKHPCPLPGHWVTLAGH